jgi:hypothetical protein
MVDIARERINRLCDRIAGAIAREDNANDIFNALCAVYTKQMSLLDCPDCRRQAARALKKSIPEMLERANAAAAARAGEAGPSLAHH